jgi:acyl-coenzyme A thioesterase PaaI-like protein
MALLELPHTSGCLVCGTANMHGLRLSLFVDDQSGVVETTFTASPEHIGFEGIVHGGVIATVVDEAMVWAATWVGKRFCVCGELNVRFRQSGKVGVPLRVVARVTGVRSRLIETTCDVTEGDVRIALGSAKYVPVAAARHQEFVRTFVGSSTTREAAQKLTSA